MPIGARPVRNWTATLVRPECLACDMSAGGHLGVGIWATAYPDDSEGQGIDMISAVLSRLHHEIPGPWLRRRLAVALVVAAMMVISFLLGARQSQRPNILTGNAIIGTSVATVFVDGWAYGFVPDLIWFSTDGVYHDHGRPECLTEVGSTAPIQFAWVAAPGPNGEFWRQVTWVRCTT